MAEMEKVGEKEEVGEMGGGGSACLHRSSFASPAFPNDPVSEHAKPSITVWQVSIVLSSLNGNLDTLNGRICVWLHLHSSFSSGDKACMS